MLVKLENLTADMENCFESGVTACTSYINTDPFVRSFLSPNTGSSVAQDKLIIKHFRARFAGIHSFAYSCKFSF